MALIALTDERLALRIKNHAREAIVTGPRIKRLAGIDVPEFVIVGGEELAVGRDCQATERLSGAKPYRSEARDGGGRQRIAGSVEASGPALFVLLRLLCRRT